MWSLGSLWRLSKTSWKQWRWGRWYAYQLNTGPSSSCRITVNLQSCAYPEVSSWEGGFSRPCWGTLVPSSFPSLVSKSKRAHCARGPFYSSFPLNSRKWVGLDSTVTGVNFHIHPQQTQIHACRGPWTPKPAPGLAKAAGFLRAPASRRTHPTFKLWRRQILSLYKLYKKLNLLGVKSNRNKVRSIWIMCWLVFQSSCCRHITEELFCSISLPNGYNKFYRRVWYKRTI